jgi:phosphoribosylanthranilate isomerase
MRVKICGLNPTRDVQLCIDLNVNFLGFVFYKKSPRNIDLDDVKILSKYNKKNSSFVAVTVNPTNEFIEKVILNNFDYIQLHGSETRKRINEIKKYNLKIIKAIKIKKETDIKKYKEFNEADIILFDTPGMEKSIKFPKDLITKLPKGKKFAIAGSISEDNIKNIINLGVNFFDLSSNLEKQVGYKDHLKIKSFMNNIKKINEV